MNAVGQVNPCNPLLAEPLYRARYIERMGTGTRDMIRRCREAGLPEPEFSVSDGFVTMIRRKAVEVTGEVRRLVLVLRGEMKRTEIQAALDLRHENYFREAYLLPALQAGYVEMTIPDKPKSSRQKYRLTAKGSALLASLRKG